MRYALHCLAATNEDGSVTFSGSSFLKGQDYSVTVPKGSIERWKAGEYIQDVCPELSKDDREFLISGFTPDEWEEMFGNGEL